MDAAAENRATGRGPDLLMAHCEALDGGRERPSISYRLERLLGPDLARLLLRALAGGLHSRTRS